MRVVVFGATGNVGSAVVRALVDDPAVDSVVGVARRAPWPEMVTATPTVDWRVVDVERDASDLVAGADVVVCLAWKIQPSHDEAQMRGTNIDGTRRVVDAVVTHRVPALVYASSVGAYGPGPKVRVTETHPTTGIVSSTYSRHKAEVEAMLDVVEAAEPWLRIVRMRTSLVFQRTAASEIHRLFLGPLLPWHLPRVLRIVPRLPRLEFQATHADDIADAYRRAITGSVAGAFNIAAEPVLTAQAIAHAVGGRSVPVPRQVVRGAALLTHQLRLQPCEPGWLDMATGTPLMDVSKAQRELGWTATRSSIDALCELFDGIGAGAGAPTEPLHPRRTDHRRRLSGRGGRTGGAH
jgi:UDP-glucose 4-epimerase